MQLLFAGDQMKNVPENNNIIVALNSESQLYQPVRLYYRIYDIEQVRSYLEEIKSIIYHPVSNEWLWLQSENTTYTPCEDIDKKVEDNNVSVLFQHDAHAALSLVYCACDERMVINSASEGIE